ncbi:MAG: hypothetical protein SGI77_02880 [Pirellulaceae bacterium]|nr:hypothetical protein [Pirellulaceae bacterium]
MNIPSSVTDPLARRSIEYADCIPNDHSSSGAFIARCYASGDRIGHCIWWLQDNGSEPVANAIPLTESLVHSAGKTPVLILASIEGNANQNWPESSPFQQIVCENVGAGGKPVLLAVGMAGKAHWSATIEGDSMTEAIAMDIACRTAAAPERLGSLYHVPTIWKATIVSNNSVLLEHPDGMSATIDSIGNAPLHFDAALRTLLIQPTIDATHHQRGQTYRWRYVLRRSI